jgi:hypothetical protein
MPNSTTESLSAALRTVLTPETRARATAVAGTIRTDGAAVAAKLLLDAAGRERGPVSGVNHAVSRERPPVSGVNHAVSQERPSVSA